MSDTREELLDNIDDIAANIKEMRARVSMLADHTFELDALRERVRELETDKLDLIDIIQKYSTSIEPWLKRANGEIDLDVLVAAFDALKEYKREHGGEL